MVFQRVLETIKVVRPTMFILENVTGLKQHKDTYKLIIHTLQHISEASGGRTYKVRARVLKSQEIGGASRRHGIASTSWAGSAQRRFRSSRGRAPSSPCL